MFEFHVGMRNARNKKQVVLTVVAVNSSEALLVAMDHVMEEVIFLPNDSLEIFIKILSSLSSGVVSCDVQDKGLSYVEEGL